MRPLAECDRKETQPDRETTAPVDYLGMHDGDHSVRDSSQSPDSAGIRILHSMMYRIIGGDKQEYGPSSADEIQQWIAEGRLNGETFTRLDPDGPWQPLANFPEFLAALEQQARALGKPPPPIPAALPRGDLNVSEALGRAFQLWTANFSLFFAASFIVWTIGMALQFLPFTALLYLPLRGVLYGGLFIVVLRRLRGEQTSLGEVFAGFGARFTQLVLVGMTVSVLSWFGFLFCVVPGVYLSVLWALSLPTAADQPVDFWGAMERSRKVVAAQWSKVFVLALIAFLPAILTTAYAELKVATVLYEALQPLMPASGWPDITVLFKESNRVAAEFAKTGMPLLLAAKFTLLFNLPFGVSAIALAYEDLIGKPARRRD